MQLHRFSRIIYTFLQKIYNTVKRAFEDTQGWNNIIPNSYFQYLIFSNGILCTFVR
jgi:hypothetical protein